jgi:universal stress protein E
MPPARLADEKPSPRYSKILAAVDPVPNEEINILNHKILELAIALTLREQSELHIVNAWTLVGEDYFRGGEIKVPKAAIDKMENDARLAAERSLNELLRPYELSKLHAKVHLLKGPAPQVIAQLAAEEQVELMVMGSIGRSGIDGVLIGNTAEQVLSKVYCSVLALKPDGFITPIRCDS